MQSKLTIFIGRYVRLKASVFQNVVRQVGHSDYLENFFVVAAIAHGLNKVICYGSGVRIAVAPNDVVLV